MQLGSPCSIAFQMLPLLLTEMLLKRHFTIANIRSFPITALQHIARCNGLHLPIFCTADHSADVAPREQFFEHPFEWYATDENMIVDAGEPGPLVPVDVVPDAGVRK